MEFGCWHQCVAETPRWEISVGWKVVCGKKGLYFTHRFDSPQSTVSLGADCVYLEAWKSYCVNTLKSFINSHLTLYKLHLILEDFWTGLNGENGLSYSTDTFNKCAAMKTQLSWIGTFHHFCCVGSAQCHAFSVEQHAQTETLTCSFHFASRLVFTVRVFTVRWINSANEYTWHPCL